jgi:hypothetical protein
LTAGRTRYQFAVTQKNEVFAHVFMTGQTVLDAKRMIVARYSLPGPSDVTLLFSGKALRDGFVLEKLRIGDNAIGVHIKSFTSLFIQTAAANRQDGAEPSSTD